MKKPVYLFVCLLLLQISCTISDPEMMEALQEIKAQNEKLLQEVEKMKSQLDALDGKYQVILASLADNKKELEALKTQIEALKTQIAQQLIKINQLSAQLEVQGADIEKLTAEIAALKASCAELKALMEELLAGRSPIPTNGLVAWYPFSGDYKDASGNNNNGTLVGSVPFIKDRNGLSNSAIQGGSGYIPTTNFFKFKRNETFSFSTWVLLSGTTCSGRLVSTESNEGHFRIGNAGNGVVIFQFGDYVNSPQMSLNIWHHLVYVYDNRNESIYLDGVLVKTNLDSSNEPLNYTNPFTIGAKASPAYDKWCDSMDDIGVWNRALTANEISKIYRGEKF
jgi:cell division protein FtsB